MELKPRRFQQTTPAKAGALGAWACALALIVFCLPVASPDVWWHLSAGRWIWTHASVPSVDAFSFTHASAPWIDFEWGFQLLLYPFGLAGDWGLWTVKALLLSLAYLPIDGMLRDRGASPVQRTLGAALWAAAILPKADLRADLVSAAFFAWQLRRLSAGRASFFAGLITFACWANLHAGFVIGLALYPAWAFVLRAAGKKPPVGIGAEACGALLGTLLNPYGFGLYAIFMSHAVNPMLAGIDEWGAFSLRYRFHWPLAAVLAAGTWAAWRAYRREPGLAVVALALTAATLFSARFGVYWPAAAVPLLAVALPAGATLTLLSLLFAASLRVANWSLPYSDIVVARRAVDFVATERDVFAPLRLFNTYEWGGYLGWRLGANGRVYGDGRYLFHGQLTELEKALTGEAQMAAFIARNHFDALLIRNFPQRLSGVRVYPDGSRLELERPWYIAFFPLKRWALVWWDSKALIFVERSKVPAEWLASHEYRWWRPGDETALAAALARGEASPASVEAERLRHGSMLAERESR